VSRKEESEILSRRVREFKSTLNDKESFIFDHRTMSEEALTLRENRGYVSNITANG